MIEWRRKGTELTRESLCSSDSLLPVHLRGSVGIGAPLEQIQSKIAGLSRLWITLLWFRGTESTLEPARGTSFREFRSLMDDSWEGPHMCRNWGGIRFYREPARGTALQGAGRERSWSGDQSGSANISDQQSRIATIHVRVNRPLIHHTWKARPRRGRGDSSRRTTSHTHKRLKQNF
jgi:hypothetical protein